ncbi:type II secretion system protein GspC [Vibrio scophthalmi]|uniref:type II secretion system protein GspC n=1 Tax=Vibrio scophthalmi TaxID=45658 RepID=UPI002FF1B794
MSLKNSQVQAKISRGLTVVLLVVCAWLAGDLVWWMVDSPSVVSRSIRASGEVTRTAPERLNLSSLQNSHLFGRYTQEAPAEAAPIQEAPKSRLNLVLVGAVVSSNSEKSLAVIANKGQQETVGIGEAIQGTRAKLVQVHSDRVIIDNAGRNETIMLQGIDYSAQSAPSSSSSKGSSTSSSSSHRVEVSPDTLERIREEIRQDAKQVFQYVRMSQIKEGDDVVGYRLSPGKDRELFDEVGLQNGDIAVQINGLDLKDAAAMTQVFNALSELTELTLTVEREGQPYEIYIEL